MTDVIRFEEAAPASLPTLKVLGPGGSVDDTLDPEPHLWARIESYTARRWSTRQCVWTLQGPGDWRPHLAPASNFVVSIWDDTLKTWSAVTADETALGFYLPKSAVYKITADVGADAGDVPQPVVEAYQRLQAYTAERYTTNVPAGAAAYSFKIGDAFQKDTTRNPNWIARAMQYSGAGDLLRGYRYA